MPTFSVGPDGRLLMDGKPIPNLYGSVGSNVTDVSTAAQGAYGRDSYDPRFYEAYQYGDGDAGMQTGYRLRPEVAQRLGDRIQLGSSGVGGYGEVSDPSQVQWDPEFGAITNRRNIRAPDDGGLYNAMANYVIPGATMAAIGTGAAGMLGYGPLAESANSGLLGGSGATPGTIPQVDTGLSSMFGAEPGATSSGGMFGAGGLDPETLSGAVGGGGSAPSGGSLYWQNFLNDPAGSVSRWAGNGSITGAVGNAITGNPMGAARLGMMGANVVGGLLGGSGGSRPSGSGGGWQAQGGLLGGGKSPQWTPNQFTVSQLQRLYGG